MLPVRYRKAFYCIVTIYTSLFCWAEAFPEQGKWSFNLSTGFPSVGITKSLYKNATVEITEITCHSEDNAQVFVWFTYSLLPCAPDSFGLNLINTTLQNSTTNKFKCQDDALHRHKKFTMPEDGIILFNMESFSRLPVTISVTVQMGGNHGYLSAIDWPLLPFYSTMCVLYAVYGFYWMIICFCYWRDLLRIQLWIGAVIFLGLVEKAVFVAEYESINKTGRSVQGAVITADLVSCFKRMLARMLVMVVSLGFGITRPRLGASLHKVTSLGCFYFALSSAYAIICDILPRSNLTPAVFIVVIPLAMTDAIIWWWIFISLVQTIRSLILKKNAVKLSLYRHFRNIIILAILASLVFMIWGFVNHKMPRCLTDWKNLWLEDAFWNALFSMILLTIIILWRPSANNQRYAYSPLLDMDDTEDNGVVNSAFGDVRKTRSTKSRPTNTSSADEDENLKWIEENIPSSVLDIQLPGLFDSDTELSQHKVQVSKME